MGTPRRRGGNAFFDIAYKQVQHFNFRKGNVHGTAREPEPQTARQDLDPSRRVEVGRLQTRARQARYGVALAPRQRTVNNEPKFPQMRVCLRFIL